MVNDINITTQVNNAMLRYVLVALYGEEQYKKIYDGILRDLGIRIGDEKNEKKTNKNNTK
jgi:hypothetical protein